MFSNFAHESLFQDREKLSKPQNVLVNDPPIGNKVVCIREVGTFVLERGPAIWRGMCCTHAGSGGIVVYDGVPDEEGFFPEPAKTRILHAIDFGPDKYKISALPLEAQNVKTEVPLTPEEMAEAEWSRNGREIYYAHPACMGMWMLDAGVQHGLTIVSKGEIQGSAPVITVTWARKKQ